MKYKMSLVNFLGETEIIKNLELSDNFYIHSKLPIYIINTCILYKICDFLFSIVSIKYREFDYSRRMYINKNLIKSLILCYFSFRYHFAFYDMFINNNWNNLLIRKLGYLYGSQDISGLIMVENLPFTTKLHHITVTIFVIINSVVDYRNFGLHKGLIQLAIFSAFPYLVNTFLGLRLFVEKGNKILIKISIISFYIYMVCIICNIISQMLLIREYIEKKTYDNDLNFEYINILTLLIYGYLLMIILYDDFILLKYLYKYPENIKK